MTGVLLQTLGWTGVLIAAVLVAAFAALIAGMMRALTRRGLATPGSAERTLGLPVLASVQKY